MSSFFDLGQTGASYVGACIGYTNTYLSQLFVVFDYYPIYIAFTMLGLTFTHFEAFYWLLTMILFIDAPLNFGIQTLIGTSNDIQPPGCPIRDEQMPAAGVQEIVALWVVGWGMVLAVFPRHVGTQKIAFFTGFASLAVYTRIYLIFNSTAQMLAAAAIGLAEGVVYLFILAALRDNDIVRYIVEFPSMTMLGFPIDTMINTAEPTVHLRPDARKIRVIIDQ